MIFSFFIRLFFCSTFDQHESFRWEVKRVFFSGLFLCELLLLVIRELRTSLFHLVMSRAVLGLTIANKCPFLHCGASVKYCSVGEHSFFMCFSPLSFHCYCHQMSPFFMVNVILLLLIFCTFANFQGNKLSRKKKFFIVANTLFAMPFLSILFEFGG